MAEEKQEKDALNVGDSIGFVALLFALIAFTVTPSVWLKLLLLLIAVIGVFVAIRLSHWTYSWSRVRWFFTSLAIASVLGAIGWPQINGQLKTEYGMTFGAALSKAAHALFGYLNRPWPQRLLCVALGILLLLLTQVIYRRVVTHNDKSKKLADSDKGFLDCKLQAENAVDSLGPALFPITKIMGEVGTVLAAHLGANRIDNSRSTAAQLRVLKQTAQKIDSLSHVMDAKCGGLEEISTLFTEGMPGWIGWMYHQPAARKDLMSTVSSLTKLISTIEETQTHTNEYIGKVEGARGVSRDMNLALDNHVRSVRRVRDANQKILEACKRTLQIANGG